MELGEMIAISIAKDAAELTSPCWFCEEQKKDKGKELKNDEKADPDTSNADKPDEVPENDIKNSSSVLGDKLLKSEKQDEPPQWIIRNPLRDNLDEAATTVVPGAHHCIPGNASFLKANQLLQFVRKGKHYSSDIGYSINHENNGVWLPGNYAVRASAKEFGKKTWTNQSKEFQNKYVERACEESGGRQFHDAHRKYNQRCLSSLNALGAKLRKPNMEKCPVCEKKLQKQRPPFGLVKKLDLISSKYKTKLLHPTKKDIDNGFYTSSKMRDLYKD